MSVSYKKLWKLLIDREIKKGKLGEMTGICGTVMAKLGRNDNVTVDTLVRICVVLDCTFDDIMEITPGVDSRIENKE
jgi:DNA-binding Xre family transcriptional regulator